VSMQYVAILAACETNDWFQVRTNYRTAVTIPERSWVRFRDILTDFIDKVGSKDGSGSGATTELGGGEAAPPSAAAAAAAATGGAASSAPNSTAPKQAPTHSDGSK
jgi:hypothetical protein